MTDFQDLSLEDFDLTQSVDGDSAPELRNYFPAKKVLGRYVAIFTTGETAEEEDTRFENKKPRVMAKAERVVLLPNDGNERHIMENQWLSQQRLVYAMKQAHKQSSASGKRVACVTGRLERDGEDDRSAFFLRPLAGDNKVKVAEYLTKMIESGELNIPDPYDELSSNEDGDAFMDLPSL